jgi:hypothetical protein
MDPSPLLDFVKALTDADRLRIVGLLARKGAARSEIAAALGLPLSDTVSHLDLLVLGGVLRLTSGRYELDQEGLEQLARGQLEASRPVYEPDPALEKRTRRVLTTYLNPDGRIKQIPPPGEKLRVLLKYLAGAFTVGVSYSEKEVNLILARFHPDTAALRRGLVDMGMLCRQRDGTRYWRPE